MSATLPAATPKRRPVLVGWRNAPTGTRVAAVVTILLLALALAGPWLAPRDPTEIAAAPFSTPSSAFPLGTDYLGEDVLSRVLAGGRNLVLLAGAATGVGYALGLMIGLLAGFNRHILDGLLMRFVDVLLAFPAVVLALLLVAGLGKGPVTLVVAIALLHMPYVARVIRSLTASVVTQSYVEAALVRGEPTWRVLRADVLPNIARQVLADAGPRLTVSVLLVAGLSFLGLGLQAPDPDWALMVSENRTGLTIQPWAVAVPVVLIATLTVTLNLLADGITRERSPQEPA